MKTMLDRRIAEVMEEHPNAVVIDEGVTGGQWPTHKPYYDPYCYGMERSNLSAVIKQHPDAITEQTAFGTLYVLKGCVVVFGAGYGGGPRMRAKQRFYALIKLNA